MNKYHYIESGLGHVYINGLKSVMDAEGDEVVEIPLIAALHAEIARGIVMSKGAISGNELRFLRTEMNMTQAQLSEKVDVDAQTVGRWEREDTSINSTAELVIRRIAGERLVDAFNESMDHLVDRVKSDEIDDDITIDAQSDGYRLCA